MKAGNRLHNGIETPPNAKVITAPSGRQCYLSGIDGNEAIVRYLDDGSLVRVALTTYKKIEDGRT